MAAGEGYHPLDRQRQAIDLYGAASTRLAEEYINFKTGLLVDKRPGFAVASGPAK